MMAPFTRWLKHKLGSGKQRARSDASHGTTAEVKVVELPLPGRDEWPEIPLSTAAHVAATNYGLFQKLPLELRQQILGHAFGHQTLHVDLTCDHPLTRRTKPPAPPKTRRWKFTPTPANDINGRALRTHAGLESELFRDTSQPKQWQWFSCVCHRRMVPRHEDDEDDGPRFRKRKIEPCDDGCIPGDRICKRRRRANTRSESLCFCESTDASASECFIGAMGWLLACRQAYLDGTHILYATNTFHLASAPLLYNLPRLLPPYHLAAITSLELIVSFNSDTLFHHDAEATRRADAEPAEPSAAAPVVEPSPVNKSEEKTSFHALCEQLPATFPRLRHLYVALQADVPQHFTYYPDDIIPDVERVVLGPVEDLFCALGVGEGKEFELAIQMGGWRLLANQITGRDPGAKEYFEVFDGGEDGSGSWYRECVWKPLGQDTGGYWLRTGWNDVDAYGDAYWMLDIWGSKHFKGECF